MPAPDPRIEARLLAILDAMDEPVSIATVVGDRDGRLLDFRLELVNQAAGAMVADAVTGGVWVGGIYDMRAIRLGDGYVSSWRQQAATPRPG